MVDRDKKVQDEAPGNDPAARGEASGGNMGYGGAGQLREQAGEDEADDDA